MNEAAFHHDPSSTPPGEGGTRVVILQPMLFPWVGAFEQVRTADVYVHLDDVQFARGFMNRVQIKTAEGWQWLTVPRVRHQRDEPLCSITPDEASDWRARHLAVLEHAYRRAPHVDDMLALVESVYAQPVGSLAALTIASMDACSRYLDLRPGWPPCRRASELNVGGVSWPRLLEMVRRFGGDVYVTGHGGRHYLDHEAFEAAGVRVEYMDYERRSYPQLHGLFNPHVSILDLIANVGRAGRDVIRSGSVPWRQQYALA